MDFVDTHAHLDVEEFRDDLPSVIARAQESSVNVLICPGITADSSRASVRLAANNRQIFAAVGIQPNYSGEAGDADWDRIVTLAEYPRVVAVGETGLDRHWDYTPLEIQRDYFDRHLRLAQDRDLPIIIHCREAEDDLVSALREAVDRAPLRGVLHAFSGNRAFASACLELGLHISLAGPVTYTNKKFQTLREAAESVPDDRLLIETDSPYLTPHPLRGKRKRNEPANLIHTARRLAELRNCPLEELATLTTANARHLFGLD